MTSAGEDSPPDTPGRVSRADAVRLGPDAYGALAENAALPESLAQLERSDEDIRAGRTEPARVALRRIARNLGLDLDR